MSPAQKMERGRFDRDNEGNNEGKKEEEAEACSWWARLVG